MKVSVNYVLGVIFVFILITGCKKYRPEDGEIPDSLTLTENSDYFTLFPKMLCDTGNCVNTGIMFYPGANVKPRAYAKMLSYWGEAGYRIVIFKMPSDLAVLAPEKAVRCKEDFPEINRWVMSGHSLGGAMASDVIAKNPDSFEGLVLLAAYPNKPINDLILPVLSVSAELDLLTTVSDIEDSKENLPQSTLFVEIQGGNHAQFGSYGEQKKDGKATITPEEQHERISEAVIPFLESL